MRKLLILAVPAAFAAVPALAQTSDVTGTVTVTGEVAPRCQFTTATAPLPLGELSDSNSELDTDTVDDKSVDLVGWCNGASAQIKVQAFALEGPAFTGGGTAFTNTVNYTATATAASATPSDSTTTEGAGDAETVGIFSGPIEVKLSNSSAGGKKLVAGDYEGQVIVTLTPNVVPVSEELPS